MLMGASRNFLGLPGLLDRLESIVRELKAAQRNMYRRIVQSINARTFES
jgi:hypothetical protein